MQFVEMDAEGNVRSPGYAPYLDYRPLDESEREAVADALAADWLSDDKIEMRAVLYATEHLIPEHLEEVRRRREEFVAKTIRAVKERLTIEINYWDHRATELLRQEEAGRRSDRLNSDMARRRASDLEARMKKRIAELEQERQLSAQMPVVIGGALVLPQSTLDAYRVTSSDATVSQADREPIDRLAVEAVVKTERRLGREPKVMPHLNPGYDIESRDPTTGRLKFIEVKGKSPDATTVTVSKTQILTALNKPDDFVLAIVTVDGDAAEEPRYVFRPFRMEPDFAASSVNYDLDELLNTGVTPDSMSQKHDP